MPTLQVPTLQVSELRELLADIDIYLLDQIFKGRIGASDRILDAGCGGGRNIAYLLRLTPRVCGIDSNEDAIAVVRRLAARHQPDVSPDNFRVESIEGSTFADGSFDVVIANAVLHFARDPTHFEAMLAGLTRMLAPTGLLFARLASSIGIETRIQPKGNGRFRLPDGSDRYLVDEAALLSATNRHRLELVEPLKTVQVQGQRCMTTWVARKTA